MGSPTQRTSKFGPNNCLTNMFLSFNFLCSEFKVSLWGSFSPRRTLKFGPNNCLTNYFLRCEFQLSMLTSSKVSFPLLRGPSNLDQTVWRTLKFGPNLSYTNIFLLCELQLSYVEQFKSFILGGSLPEGPQIWSKQLSHK